MSVFIHSIAAAAGPDFVELSFKTNVGDEANQVTAFIACLSPAGAKALHAMLHNILNPSINEKSEVAGRG